MDERMVRVGVIGLGKIAHIAELPALASLKNVRIVAAMARTEASLKQAAAKYPIESLHTDFNEFIRTDMDCAFVLTPKTEHTFYVRELLGRGIDVFCEKPIAMSLHEGREMVDLAEKNGRLLMIGFNRRFAPVYQKARLAFQNRVPDVVVAQKSRNGTEFHATLENSIHMVDLLRWFCGEAVHIDAQSQFTDINYETTCTAQIRFDSGAIGILVATRGAGQWLERMEAYGGGQTAIVNAPDNVTIVDATHEETVSMTPLALGWARVEDKMGFSAEVQHFIHCVQTREQPVTNAADAFKTHELMNRILLAAGLPGMEE